MQFVLSEVDDGIPASRIVLAGFSQGGALALFTGVHSPHRLGGLLSMSSWMPCVDTIPAASDITKELLSTPVLMVHGVEDKVSGSH